MPIRRGSPFDELERVLDRLNEQFEDDLGRLGRQVAVDVEDAGDRFVVTADLPGFETEDVEVELRGATLHLSAERDEESERGDARYLRRERRRESVTRAVTLPEEVDESAVSAEYENGVLTVDLPKAGRGDDATNIEVQ